MTRRRSLESVRPRMRSIFGSLSITSPACTRTHSSCQGLRVRRKLAARARGVRRGGAQSRELAGARTSRSAWLSWASASASPSSSISWRSLTLCSSSSVWGALAREGCEPAREPEGAAAPAPKDATRRGAPPPKEHSCESGWDIAFPCDSGCEESNCEGCGCIAHVGMAAWKKRGAGLERFAGFVALEILGRPRYSLLNIVTLSLPPYSAVTAGQAGIRPAAAVCSGTSSPLRGVDGRRKSRESEQGAGGGGRASAASRV